MKRPRPHIPLYVRILVARQQMILSLGPALTHPGDPRPKKIILDSMLEWLFGDEKYHLDHNPALILRKFNPRTGKYSPDANDPAHLIYRTIHDHHLKTHVHGDGAQRSDTSERVHWRKVERNKVKRATSKSRPKVRMPKRKLPSRPFPQGRKFESARR